MHWHAELTSLLLRGYTEPDGYAEQRKFQAVVGAKFLGPGAVFLEGALRVDGQELQRADWGDLAALLHGTHGAHTAFAKRNGKLAELDLIRWAALRTKR